MGALNRARMMPRDVSVSRLFFRSGKYIQAVTSNCFSRREKGKILQNNDAKMFISKTLGKIL